MSNIVERLRTGPRLHEVMLEAADEIERLYHDLKVADGEIAARGTENERLHSGFHSCAMIIGGLEAKVARLTELAADCYRLATDQDNYGPHGRSKSELQDRLAEIANLCRTLEAEK
jgi:hypothetical protein